MNKVKKALIGTALVGSLVVGAGFGTYSWFTSNATVSGSVDNAVIKISPETETLNFKVIDNEKLAPSRTAFSKYVNLKNHSSEDTWLTIDFKSELSGGESGADLSAYRSASVIRVNYLSWPVGPVREALDKHAIQKILDSEITSQSQIEDLYENWENYLMEDKIFFLDGNEDQATINEIAEAIANEEAVTLAWKPRDGKPPWAGQPGGNPNPGNPNDGEEEDEDVLDPTNPRLFERNVLSQLLLANNKSVNILMGVKLKEDADNDYQRAIYSAEFKVELNQTDRPRN